MRRFEAPKSTPAAIAAEVEKRRNATSKKTSRARKARGQGPTRRNRSDAYQDPNVSDETKGR